MYGYKSDNTLLALDVSLHQLVQSYSSFNESGDEDLINKQNTSTYIDVIETNYI